MVRAKHRIGRFRVIAPIGAGGFSTVYRALDEENGREVALKVLAENHSLVADTRRRFVEEFELRGAVSSPYIADVYEVGETDSGQPFMVVELADGGDLRRRVEELRQAHHTLTRTDLLNLARHLTEALSALHNADIVHRDVSPGNILIRSRPGADPKGSRLVAAAGSVPHQGPPTLLEPRERLLLADLGHAKDLLRASGFTAGGGTQGFAAPEQRDDVTVVDHRADIFSATAIIEWAAHGGPFSDKLEPFYDVGLAAEPDDRYPTMTEWYQAIAAVLNAGDRGRSRSRRRRANRPRTEASHHRVTPPGPLVSQPIAPGPPGPVEPAGSPWARRLGTTVAVALLIATPVAVVLGYDYYTNGREPVATTESGVAVAGVDASTQSTLVVAGGENSAEWAAVAEPADGSVIDGELQIIGTAGGDEVPPRVEIEVEQLATGRSWSPATQAFTATTGGQTEASNRASLERFPVEVSDPETGRFEATIPADGLEPGRYVIRVWVSDPTAEPTTRTVTVV